MRRTPKPSRSYYWTLGRTQTGRVPSVVEKGFDASPDEQFLL